MSDRRCICGHREYDHITEDGTCWKCPCQEWKPEPDE